MTHAYPVGLEYHVSSISAYDVTIVIPLLVMPPFSLVTIEDSMQL